MIERLTAQAWVDFAVTTLAREGFDVLKADVLARKLGVSRGSFYWHFSDLAAFHARVIEHWRQTTTEAIIVDIERHESRESRLDALLRRAFAHGAALEVRMRAWADVNPGAARAVADVDRRRREYLESLLVDVGIVRPLAAARAQLLYWTYLGAALSRTRPPAERLDPILDELKLLALGGAVPSKRPRSRA
jgi:AcrR family transcriptional regulator